MLNSIDVKFIFDSARLRLFSSANILQIADVALRVVFTTKTTQPRPQVFSVNGVLTCSYAALLTSLVN